MTRITLDAALAEQLAQVKEAELCGPDGRVIGRFVPSVIPLGWVPASSGITEEELERRRRSDARRYTTAEVIVHLESL